MAGMGIDIKVVGMQKVIINLGDLKLKGVDLTPAMKRGGLVMLSSINQNFARGGRPVAWRPLKDATLKTKLKKGYGPYPLIRTGNLRKSISAQPGPESLIIGTSIIYGRTHQQGRGAIPARPYLLFQKSDIQQIQKLILRYLGFKAL